MRKLLLLAVLVAGCGSVVADGPEAVVTCPMMDPTQASSGCAVDGTVNPGPGGQPATVYRCGSMVVLTELIGMQVVPEVICCVDNVPPGTAPGVDIISMCP